MTKLEKKTILLIEDDGAIAKSIEETLSKQKNNYNIFKAFGFISAMGKWKEAQKKGIEFDYIILDMNIGVAGMPNDLVNDYYPFTGMAFLNEIWKNNEELRNKLINKILIYTGYEIPLKTKAIEKGWKIDDMQIIPKRPDSIKILINKIIS